MSGGVVTPESQMEESTSPADTTEEDPLPLKPWGRSQSLPAYADLIMVNHINPTFMHGFKNCTGTMKYIQDIFNNEII